MKKRIIVIILAFFMLVNTVLIVCALNITPLTIKRTTFVYEYGNDISTDPQYYINANETILSQVVLNFSSLKNEVGKYKVSATYLGVEYPFYIKIVDTTNPVVTLKAVTFNVNLNTKIYAIDLIESVEDSSFYTAYFKSDDGKKEAYKTFNKEGSYVENIIVEDESGNQSAKLRVKIVAGQNGNNPTLSGIDNIEIIKGSEFDPLEGVEATDGNGKDITNKIKILKNNVNSNKVGEYEVIYSITNSKGHTLQRTRRVKVIKSKG